VGEAEQTLRIVIPYEPRPQFMPLHENTKRWSITVAHRRAGKTVAEINKLIRRALECPLLDPRFAYAAPTYGQAKDVAWNYLLRYTAPIPGARPHETELRVDLPNGAVFDFTASTITTACEAIISTALCSTSGAIPTRAPGKRSSGRR
jgi:hypothetical protein